MPDFNASLIPSPSKLPAILIAAGILVAAAAVVFYFNPHKTAELSITQVQLYPVHTVTPMMKGTSQIIGEVPQANDDLYVLLTVKLADTSRLPLFIKDETVVLTAPDHSISEASAVPVRDFANLYTMFPALKTLASAPLARDTQVAPGQAAEGMVMLYFPGAKQEDWQKRESATLTLDLFHGPSQTLKIP